VDQLARGLVVDVVLGGVLVVDVVKGEPARGGGARGMHGGVIEVSAGGSVGSQKRPLLVIVWAACITANPAGSV